MSASRRSDVAAAIEVLAKAGIQVVMPESVGAVGVATAAARLDVSKDWIRTHLDEFPGWYRLPAGSSGLGQPAGGVRIPIRDLDLFEERRKKLRACVLEAVA